MCLHVAAKANMDPSEGKHYVTVIIFQLPQQTVSCTFTQPLRARSLATFYVQRKLKV